jgi:hypothetical protein
VNRIQYLGLAVPAVSVRKITQDQATRVDARLRARTGASRLGLHANVLAAVTVQTAVRVRCVRCTRRRRKWAHACALPVRQTYDLPRVVFRRMRVYVPSDS